MKKPIRTLLGLFIVLEILVSSIQPIKAEGIDYYRYKNFIYSSHEMRDGYLAITNYKGNKKSVSVPQKIKGKIVSHIISLKSAKKLNKIHLSKYISVADLADAPALKRVTVSKNNKYFIAKNNLLLNKKRTTLKVCPGGVKKLRIPSYVKKIGPGAFRNGKIETIQFGKNIVKIDTYAFEDCKELKTIQFNSKLRIISNTSFNNCSSLEQVTIPSKVREIGDRAFGYCKNLKSVIINSSNLKIIDSCAFSECYSLKDIYLMKINKVPRLGFDKETYNAPFGYTKKGINFHVKNKKVAKELKKKLRKSGVKDANIYAGKTLVYTKVN